MGHFGKLLNMRVRGDRSRALESGVISSNLKYKKYPVSVLPRHLGVVYQASELCEGQTKGDKMAIVRW